MTAANVCPFYTGFFCKCSAAFMGTNCEIGISPCASNPCLYGGTCIPRGDDYYCQCRGQYSGQRYVETITDLESK